TCARARGVSIVRGRGVHAPGSGRDPRSSRGDVPHVSLPRQAPSPGDSSRDRRLCSLGSRLVTAGCRDLERVLRGDSPELFAAFEEHAASCPACARELAEWMQISAGAPSLKKRWASPQVWPAIRQQLAEESQRPQTARTGGFFARALPGLAIASL